MIAVQTVIDRIEFILDSEGSDRYKFEQDYKPAINMTVEWLASVFNAAFSNKKLTEENLRDLLYSRVWETSEFSKFKFDSNEVGHKLWSIISVDPEPNLFPESPILTSGLQPYESKFRSDITFIDSDFSANRLTKEEWNENKKNIFEAGNQTLLGDLKSYAYLNPINYSSSSAPVNTGEISVRPDISRQFVAMTYLKFPTPINVISDQIEYPETLTDLVSQKSANFISYKQGDGTNLYAVTERDVSRLVQLMI